ncbi:CopD family protein [Asticcacaulis sp. 201]|uniref:CopD family protein n=1 Tax=Asticcacaulis sp. 201 TaxID=3028787 RepID=UPI002916F8F9|nr:CopD family protein [Asticcacaulis sp. 201]MDV6331451.1 CopD family protein [Asticcacaulis sp. 201]
MNWYDLVRGLHILAVIAWMAGLLYLPRLFIYHIKNADVPAVTSVFNVMERNLLRIIMNPAMIVAWILGGILLYMRFHAHWESLLSAWILVKLAGVVAMTGYHHLLSSRFKKLQRGEPIGTESFWRKINEVPFVLAIIMVLSVTLEYGSR